MASEKKIALAPDQFPELNATLYQSSPASFLTLRTQSLLLMLTQDDLIAPVYAGQAEIGSLRVGGGSLPDRDARELFVALESTVLFHHAAETLWRLFLAHKGTPECPWLQIVDLTSFKDFKDLVGKLVENDGEKFDRKEIARVFLGGTTPEDSAIDLNAEAFDAAIDAYVALLVHAGLRLLNDAFIYNAAKHGLSGVPMSGMKMSVQHGEDESLPVMEGIMIASLQKTATPTEKRKHQAEWYTAMTNVLIDQDLLLVQAFARAIDSLWDVARRQYLGVPGKVSVFDKFALDAIICEPVRLSNQHVRSVTYELATTTTYKNGSSKLNAVDVRLHPSLVPREYFKENTSEEERTIHATPRLIDLPLRPHDERETIDDGQYYLPFSPRRSQAEPGSAHSSEEKTLAV
jgi:hypothetical protein